jgi:hypothetical protein
MSLFRWARRARARRRVLTLALLVTLAAGASASAYKPRTEGGGGMAASGWRPMFDHHMGADMPDMESASARDRALARSLMRRTARRLAQLSTIARARRAGYRAAGRWSSQGIRHYNSRRAESDGHVLDPARPESVLFWRHPGGRARAVAAMFRAPSDRPPPHMDNPLLRWHVHYVCTKRVPGAPRQLRMRFCRPGTVARYGVTQMLHVWRTGDLMSAYAMNPPLDALASALGPR